LTNGPLFSGWKRLINGALAFCKQYWVYAIIIIPIASLFMYFVGFDLLDTEIYIALTSNEKDMMERHIRRMKYGFQGRKP